MNFTVEVPGEANPLSIQNLYHVLESASSADNQQVKTGAQQLANWEKQDGFYSSLQSVFIDTSLPLEIRYLSAIQLKNGVDKYWRKTATNALKKEEKALIRSRCIKSGIEEPDHRLALQNALVIAKIIRLEYPHEWPDAISVIVENLRSNSRSDQNPSRLSRVLMVLLYTIKELSTGRLLRIREHLQAAAPEILQVLGNIYVEKVNSWKMFLDVGGDDEGGALDSIEQSLLALRILRRLIIAGYDFPNRHGEVQEFWKIIGAHLEGMLTLVLRELGSINLTVKHLIEKHLVQIAKLHLEMVRTHPSGFALLSNSTDLARSYWRLIFRFSKSFGSQTLIPFTRIGNDGDADEEEGSIEEKMSLKGLLLLRGCVKMVFNPAQSFKYQQAQDKAEKKNSVDLMRDDLLTQEFVCEIMETLITRFFVFRSRDLRDWEEEPEEWERREEGDGDIWEFSIRSCSEKLFLDLVIHFKDLLVQPLLNVFRRVANVENTNILLKDSVYAAVGIAAPVLQEKLDFSTFLESTLVPEVQIQQPGYNIIRRRIAIILGQWLPVREGLNRPLVYQIFQHLLDKGDYLNDQVVRVTSGRQLKNVIDPFEFLAEPFVPYAKTIFSRLMQLIEEVELSETKLALLNTVNVIIVKMEHHIITFADQLFGLLPPLWDQAGEEFLRKQAILAILCSLITSMKEESRRFHSTIIPLIENSVQSTSETRVYLLEDALELWSSILIQTASPASQDIISLAQHLFPLYESGSENFRKALDITETYILLIPQHFLSESPRLLIPFAGLLDTAKREAAGLITHIVELLIRSANYIGGSQAITPFVNDLISTNFLSSILIGLKTAYSAHQTTGPNHVNSSVDGIVETDYFGILARLALTSPTLFISALAAALPNDGIESTISWLLSEWFSHFDNISHPEKKKLSCLALTALLDTNQPWILNRLQELMTIWTDTIGELADPENDGTDCLIYWDEGALKPDGPEAPADERRRRLNFADPVHRLDVKVFAREKLSGAVVACGGHKAFEAMWVANVDKEVVGAFGALGVI